MTPERFSNVLHDVGAAADRADVPDDAAAARSTAEAAETAAVKLQSYAARVRAVFDGDCDCPPDLDGRGYDCGLRIAPSVRMEHKGCPFAIITWPFRALHGVGVLVVRQCRRTVRILKSAASPSRPLVAAGETVHPPTVSPPSPRLVERPPAPSQRQPRPAEPVPVVGRGTNLDEAQR